MMQQNIDIFGITKSFYLKLIPFICLELKSYRYKDFSYFEHAMIKDLVKCKFQVFLTNKNKCIISYPKKSGKNQLQNSVFLFPNFYATNPR